MEWEASSNTYAKRLQEKVSQVGISLDLHTTGLLDANRPEEDLAARRGQIREEVFRVLSEQILPQITEGMGYTGPAPENGNVRNRAMVKSQWHIDGAPGGTVSTRHRMEAGFVFEADQDIHPVAVLYLCRGNVAAAMTDVFLNSLDTRYFGAVGSLVDSEIRMGEDAVKSYRVEERADPAERPAERSVERPAGPGSGTHTVAP